jgi:hypothetical protein
MDEYCKKHSICHYAYINDSSTMYTSQLFNSSLFSLSTDKQENSNNLNIPYGMNNQTNGTLNATNHSYIRIRSLIEKGYKFIEKKFNLNEFLANSNTLINNMSSYNSITSSYLQNSGFQYFPNSSNTSLNCQQSSTSSNFGSSGSLASSIR